MLLRLDRVEHVLGVCSIQLLDSERKPIEFHEPYRIDTDRARYIAIQQEARGQSPLVEIIYPPVVNENISEGCRIANLEAAESRVILDLMRPE